MSKFIINGKNKIEGEISISGMKNATTPILAATLLTKETCIISNVPNISDVKAVIEIMKNIGSKIEYIDEHTLKICNENINPCQLDDKAVRKMRSSVLFMGPLLARFHEIDLPEPGGCIIGNRPLDSHISGFQQLGAKIIKNTRSYKMSVDKLIGNKIVLPEFSVTATENIIMAAVLAEGTTTINLAACEPHVQDLCIFLNKTGAKISGIGTHQVIIEGVKELKGSEHKIIPDQIEIGTFIVLAAATHGKLKINNIEIEHLDIILLKLKEIGVEFEIGDNYLTILPTSNLKSFKLQTLPYPGFPTDLQSVFGVLATQCQGTTLIQDPLFEGRMGYLNELIKMGANAIIADPHRAIISGPTPLYGTEIKSLDLRAGAALIIAALLADGESVLDNVEIIDRGYERIEERLSSIGAKIQRIE